MVSSSKRAYVIPRSVAPRAPALASDHCWPMPPQETLKQFCLSLHGVSGSCFSQRMFEPSESLWWVWGLILKVFRTSNHLAGASPLPLDVGYFLKVTSGPHTYCSRAYCLSGASLPLDGEIRKLSSVTNAKK